MKAKLVQRAAVQAPIRRRSADQRSGSATPAPPRLQVLPGGLDAGTILRLQATAGNSAVGALLAQRAVDCPPPPSPLATPAPEEFPGFQTVAGRVGQDTRKLKAHPSARSRVAEADRAAAGPTNEVRGKAAADQVGQMGRQKPGAFDKAAFITAVKAAIDKATPKTMQEVDDFSSSGKPGQLKEQVVGQVGKGKDTAASGIKTASDATPDTSRQSPKPVTPMGQETPGAAPAGVGAEGAMPVPKPEDQVGLGYTKCTTDNQLDEANVTQEQVAESNEPQFQDAMAAKQDADQHAETAPQQFRQDEQAALDQSKSDAGASAQAGLSEMHQVRGSALAHVGTHKDQEKGKNETTRAKVSTDIEAIYTATKQEVDEILGGLDKKVSDAFNSGEGEARQAFESYYKTKKDEYFDDRYSGVFGGARWLKDKLVGPPDKVNAFIDEAKALYQTRMGQVIDQIATIVETDLTRATQRIADGRQKINDYVASQPKQLREVAQQAATQVSSQFDQLEQSVSDKGNSLVNDLAQKYVAAAKAVDERCDAMREENKGLLQKAWDKVKGMIEAIGKVKDMLVSLAEKVAGVIGDIITHPIRFLENLISAVKQGFDQFVDHIWTHLKKGLLTWLFGEVAKAGITLPDSFDLKGILMFLAQVLGLTWANIRARAVNILGAGVVGMIEQGEAAFEKVIEIYNVIKEEGIAGVWHLMQDKVSEIKGQVMDAVGGMVVDEVITAGIKWVIGLLNPASAFIKACMAIYDIVTFFIHHWDDIVELVNTVVDNLAMIVAGNISAAATLVENALARAIPMAIGFLASLLGLGDLGEKIKGIIEKIREPVNEAVDWVLNTVVKPAAGVAVKAAGWVKGKVKSGVDFVKAKAKAGVDWAKAKVKRGADWVKGKFSPDKDKTGGEDVRSPGQKQIAVDTALRQVEAIMAEPGSTRAKVARALPAIKSKYGLNQLRVVNSGSGAYHVHAELNPTANTKDATDASATGMVDAYRGIHFLVSWDPDTVDRQLRADLVGQPTWSAAAREIAGSTVPDGSDVSRADLEAAARIVQARVKETKDPNSVKQWWSTKKQVFESYYFAMLQRYVNTYDAYRREAKSGLIDAKSGGKLKFHSIPFISTSKNPVHSAAYALGEKFIADEEKRKTGIVGRVFVYLFSVNDIKAQDPANVEQVNAAGKVKIKARIIHEGEVAFTGSIPGENLVGQHDATAGQSAAALGNSAKQTAKTLAASQGGLKDWD